MGVASLQWVYCGSGQPSAGVHGEAKRREGAGEGRGTGDVGRI